LIKAFLSRAPVSVSSSDGRISPKATAEILTSSKYKMSPKLIKSKLVQ